MNILDATFSIKDKQSLTFLADLYENVHGELHVLDDTTTSAIDDTDVLNDFGSMNMCRKFLSNIYRSIFGGTDKKLKSNYRLSIERTENPFRALLNDKNINAFLETPFEIDVKLSAPDTIRAVSVKLIKIDPNGFYHPNQSLILEWADYIDKNLRFEMNRENQFCVSFDRPKSDLTTMNELYLAACLSKYAVYLLPNKDGYIISHPKSYYLSWIGLHDNSYGDTSIMFDKDDGFWCAMNTQTKYTQREFIGYLNMYFSKWKVNEYRGKLSDYFNL